MWLWRRASASFIVVIAVASVAAIIYFVAQPTQRLLFSLIPLAAIVVTVVQLMRAELADRVGDALVPRRRFHTRRFIRLRFLVEQFLEEVRRLHRVAVDAERGSISLETAREELDRIEQRLVVLIREIRSAAAVESDQAEFGVAETPNARG